MDGSDRITAPMGRGCETPVTYSNVEATEPDLDTDVSVTSNVNLYVESIAVYV